MHFSNLRVIEEQYSSREQEIDFEYEDFMDLYSKSILIALYSLNESKLNAILDIGSKMFCLKTKPLHLASRNYMDSSIVYLNLVMGIEKKQIKNLHI